MSRIQVPMEAHLLGQQRQVEFGCSVNPGPTATPIIIPALMPNEKGQQLIMSFGGLTKLEHGALLIAASLAHAEAEDQFRHPDKELPDSPGPLARLASDLAAATLAECAKRQPEIYQPGK